MNVLFLTVLNMSLTGAFVIAVICLARLLLKRAPKLISYCLWAVAGFRLVFPFTIERVWSLIPFRAQPIPTDIGAPPVPVSPPPAAGNVVSDAAHNAGSALPPAVAPGIEAAAPELGAVAAYTNPLQFWTNLGATVWLIGLVGFILYGIISYLFLRRKMQGAVLLHDNVYEASQIQTPFVLGVFAPKIYLPQGLSASEREYIILHEQTHIKRFDHIIKFAAYFILCLHWFNPLAWVAFLLMCVDMEMACDEQVLRVLGTETKTSYSMTLVTLASNRRLIAGAPLAFGEGGIKERVKNILKFKKVSRFVTIAAIALVVALTLGFAVSQADSRAEDSAENTPETYIVHFSNHPNNPNAISRDEAAKLATQYVRDIFGESTDGTFMHMFYFDSPNWTRENWDIQIVTTEREAGSGNLFTLRLDAITGELLDIGRPQDHPECLQRSQNPQAFWDEFDQIVRDSRALGEWGSFGRILTDEEFYAYEQIAEQHAQRLFDLRGTTGAAPCWEEWTRVPPLAATPRNFQRDESGQIVAMEHIVSFQIIDETGRIAWVTLIMDTGELLSIETSSNDWIFDLPEEETYVSATPGIYPQTISFISTTRISGDVIAEWDIIVTNQPHPMFEALAPGHVPSADALSALEAAKVGNYYIFDLFGANANLDGHIFHMVYHAHPENSRTHWHGTVFNPHAEDELFRYNPMFSFVIDAITGQRIDILGPARFFDETAEGTPVSPHNFLDLVRFFAEKQFHHTDIQSIEAFEHTSGVLLPHELPTEPRILVGSVTDSTGHNAMIAICMFTQELISIHTQHNDTSPHFVGLGMG